MLDGRREHRMGWSDHELLVSRRPVTLRLPLTASQEAARAAALRQYEHKMTALPELARSTNCLPIYIDWTAFLGLASNGECIWVDHDVSPGNVEPITDLQQLSVLVARVHLVPGLEDLAPRRPLGREDCSQCGGKGYLVIGTSEMICRCGGLGWIAASPAELGAETS